MNPSSPSPPPAPPDPPGAAVRELFDRILAVLASPDRAGRAPFPGIEAAVVDGLRRGLGERLRELRRELGEALRILDQLERLCATPGPATPDLPPRQAEKRPRTPAPAPPAISAAPPPARAVQPVRSVGCSAPATPVPKPAANRPQASVRRPAAHFLTLTCPRCGAAGQASVDRLDQVFQCRGCSRLFHVHPSGRLEEVRASRDAQGKVTLQPRRPRRPRHRLAWVVALLLLLGGTALATWHRGGDGPVPEQPLPDGLEARAELLTRAWLAQDLRTLRRLTTRTHERELFPWFLANKPPVERATSPPGLAVRVQTEETGGGTARVVARVDGVNSPGPTPGPVTLNQEWVVRAGTWFFVPDAVARR
jgi:hypothetical protein